MITTHTNRIALSLAAVLLLCLSAPSLAAIAVTDGDFNDISEGDAARPNNNSDDEVTGWFDDTDDFASATHDDRNHSFAANTTPHALFASEDRNGDSGQTSYIYQNIGTRDAADIGVQVDFEMGRPTDGAGTATISVVVSLYSSATFAGSDGSLGYLPTAATDEVLIDTETITLAAHGAGAGNAQSVATSVFDLSGVNTTDSLFLMFQTNSGGSAFFQIDNVALTVSSIPAPAALPAGLVMLAAICLRRRR